MTTKFQMRFRMGKPVDDGEHALYEYLAAPEWACEWYWAFGYLQNKDIHHHIDTLDHTRNMKDALRAYYGDSLTITDEDDLWTFCELMRSFYVLKETAEVLGRGGTHFASNPVSSVIKNEAEARRINHEVMPAVFDALEVLLSKYR